MEARRDIFHAIADPTRRKIIGLIAANALSISAIANHFTISRPAISQQVKILEECGLVVIRKEGRERICNANLEKMAIISAWLDQYKNHWEEKLDSLEAYLTKVQNKKYDNK